MSNKGVCRTALATPGLVISCVVCFSFKAKLTLFCNTYVKLSCLYAIDHTFRSLSFPLLSHEMLVCNRTVNTGHKQGSQLAHMLKALATLVRSLAFYLHVQSEN